MTRMVDPTKLISLTDAGLEYGYNPEHLRQLVVAKRLEAWFVGNTWITTRANMKAYIRSRKRTDRPPQGTPRHSAPRRNTKK